MRESYVEDLTGLCPSPTRCTAWLVRLRQAEGLSGGELDRSCRNLGFRRVQRLGRGGKAPVADRSGRLAVPVLSRVAR